MFSLPAILPRVKLGRYKEAEKRSKNTKEVTLEILGRIHETSIKPTSYIRKMYNKHSPPYRFTLRIARNMTSTSELRVDSAILGLYADMSRDDARLLIIISLTL